MKYLSLLFSLGIIVSCSAPKIATQIQPSNYITVKGKLFATVFQEKAAEYRALCYQAYNIARLRVDQFKNGQETLPPAIMTDIDETVLSNAAYQAQQTLKGQDYDADSWFEWTEKGEADTVPGALKFFQYAASKGFTVFYVTNRNENERQGTLKNLKAFGFPYATNENLLLREKESSKRGRKEQIMREYNIIMFVGDNLNDMSDAFEKKDPQSRFAVTDHNSSLFGDKYIILPNSVYGDWENSLYRFNHALTPAQKDSILKTSLTLPSK